jgi:hypothetical protein
MSGNFLIPTLTSGRNYYNIYQIDTTSANQMSFYNSKFSIIKVKD